MVGIPVAVLQPFAWLPPPPLACVRSPCSAFVLLCVFLRKYLAVVRNGEGSTSLLEVRGAHCGSVTVFCFPVHYVGDKPHRLPIRSWAVMCRHWVRYLSTSPLDYVY